MAAVASLSTMSAQRYLSATQRSRPDIAWSRVRLHGRANMSYFGVWPSSPHGSLPTYIGVALDTKNVYYAMYATEAMLRQLVAAQIEGCH